MAPWMEVLALVGGISGILSTLYMIFNVGFRVDVLWKDRARDQEIREKLATAVADIENLQRYVFVRAESEARVKKAVTPR